MARRQLDDIIDGEPLDLTPPMAIPGRPGRPRKYDGGHVPAPGARLRPVAIARGDDDPNGARPASSSARPEVRLPIRNVVLL